MGLEWRGGAVDGFNEVLQVHACTAVCVCMCISVEF